jgi:hypothetical protein
MTNAESMDAAPVELDRNVSAAPISLRMIRSFDGVDYSRPL